MQKIFLSIALLIFLNGCSTMHANSGLIYTNISYPIISTENEERSKSTTVVLHSIFGLFTIGDASLEQAKKQGNIKKVSHVDVHEFIILGVYRKYSVTVYGE